MARLTTERKAVLTFNNEAVTFYLKEPSNERLNRFLAARYNVERKKLRDNSHETRCEFFDELLVRVENLEDAEGCPIAPEKKDLIPANWKADIIFRLFEDTEIDVKN